MGFLTPYDHALTLTHVTCSIHHRYTTCTCIIHTHKHTSMDMISCETLCHSTCHFHVMPFPSHVVPFLSCHDRTLTHVSCCISHGHTTHTCITQKHTYNTHSINIHTYKNHVTRTLTQHDVTCHACIHTHAPLVMPSMNATYNSIACDMSAAYARRSTAHPLCVSQVHVHVHLCVDTNSHPLISLHNTYTSISHHITSIWYWY